jgi:hypothetical protein
MAAFVYTYSDGDFQPDGVSMFGYVIYREAPTEVDDETAAKLDAHPHFQRVGGKPDIKPVVAVADAVANVPDQDGLLEDSDAKLSRKDYMREYMRAKRAKK